MLCPLLCDLSAKGRTRGQDRGREPLFSKGMITPQRWFDPWSQPGQERCNRQPVCRDTKVYCTICWIFHLMRWNFSFQHRLMCCFPHVCLNRTHGEHNECEHTQSVQQNHLMWMSYICAIHLWSRGMLIALVSPLAAEHTHTHTIQRYVPPLHQRPGLLWGIRSELIVDDECW